MINSFLALKKRKTKTIIYDYPPHINLFDFPIGKDTWGLRILTKFRSLTK